MLLSPAYGLYQNRKGLLSFYSQNKLFLQILSISGFNVKYLASLPRSSYKMLHYFCFFPFPSDKGISSIFTGHITCKVSTGIQVSHLKVKVQKTYLRGGLRHTLCNGKPPPFYYSRAINPKIERKTTGEVSAYFNAFSKHKSS